MRKYFVYLVFAVLSLSSSFGSAAPESREASLSKIQFDGKVFSYEIVAYEADPAKEVKTQVVTQCKFGNFNGSTFLKSIDFKIFLTADFSVPSAAPVRTGSVDVRKEIEACVSVAPAAGKLNAPVTLNFPKVSVSQKIRAN